MNEQAILASLTSINAYRKAVTGTPGNTTTTAAVASGDSTVAVTALTNFTDGDPVFQYGSGGMELLEIDGTPDLDMPVARPVMIAQEAGAKFVEAVKYTLGHIAEGSASFGPTSSNTPIPAATSGAPIGYFFVPGALAGKFGLLNFNPRSLSLAFAQAEVTTGTGTAADPTQMLVNGQTIGTQGLLCFRGNGLLKDGTFVEVDFLDCTVSGTVDVNISGKAAAPIPVAFNCTGYIIRTWQ
jgi:hypothetical protein